MTWKWDYCLSRIQKQTEVKLKEKSCAHVRDKRLSGWKSIIHTSNKKTGYPALNWILLYALSLHIFPCSRICTRYAHHMAQGNICCDGKEASSNAGTEAAKRDTVLVCIFPPHFLLFIAMRLEMDCAWTMEPSLRARSPIPHIHGDDRTHPSVLSLHAESESLRSHCSALSVEAWGHAGVGAEEKNSACSW